MTSPASTSAALLSAPRVSRQKKLVMGNWKMNGSSESNETLVRGILQDLGAVGGDVDVAVCAPFPYLAQVAGMLGGASVSLGAQDVSKHSAGAYTGEVSAGMLKEFGCRWVLVGHSERRSMHGESDSLVADKASAALFCGLTPVVCVGESLSQRDAGELELVISRQLQPVLALGSDAVSRMVIAYEPVWAIGTGRSATAEQAQAVHAFIRSQLPSGAVDIPLLYGGSVKADNAAVLFGMPDIDGALVGGASLVAKDFVAIALHGAAKR